MKTWLKTSHPRDFLVCAGMFMALGVWSFTTGEGAVAVFDGLLALVEITLYYLVLGAQDEE